jgi:hypothetical protein
LPEELDDTQLEKLLFPPVLAAPTGSRSEPDFAKAHQELKANRSVTLQLLWEEYKEDHPDSGLMDETVMEEKPGTAKHDLWAGRIAEQKRSGLSVKQFCKEQGITVRPDLPFVSR